MFRRQLKASFRVVVVVLISRCRSGQGRWSLLYKNRNVVEKRDQNSDVILASADNLRVEENSLSTHRRRKASRR